MRSPCVMFVTAVCILFHASLSFRGRVRVKVIYYRKGMKVPLCNQIFWEIWRISAVLLWWERGDSMPEVPGSIPGGE